jgi:Immunity protein Imm1
VTAQILSIVSDNWNGLQCREQRVEYPSEGDALDAVRALDGRTRTLVAVNAADGSSLTIGGGAGQYVAYVSTNDEKCFNLLADQEHGSGTVSLVAGGQEGDYPAEQVVELGQVLRAVRFFYQMAGTDNGQRWRSQW